MRSGIGREFHVDGPETSKCHGTQDEAPKNETQHRNGRAGNGKGLSSQLTSESGERSGLGAPQRESKVAPRTKTKCEAFYVL